MAGKVLVFFLIVYGFFNCYVYSLELKKVLVVSRHNLRTPLTATLARMTPKEWPKWSEEVGNLTPKGALLESYMGEYFSAWMYKEGLLSGGCPGEDTVHIYANTRQRTKATAIAFTKAAFPNCNVTVNFKNIQEMDPIFNPVVHNTTDTFKQLAKQEMEDKLNESDLKDVYVELNHITDIKNSEICKEEGYCDLSTDKNVIVFEVGEEPNVFGPFFIANAMADSFLMSFYEGFAFQDIGWGKIENEDQWKLLAKVITENQNVRFNLTTAAKDLSQPLIGYLKEKLESDTKFTLLVGHDSNLNPMLATLGFKTFVLPEQLEFTPVGGKLVFQKWTDGEKDYLKVEFVYQSRRQLRDAEKLTLLSPPKNITMYLKNCVADENGFCPWENFETILNQIVQ